MILFGMESDLADQLSRILLHDGHHVRTTCSMDTALGQGGADIVFAGGDGPDYRDTMRHLLNLCPAIPVVLVNRMPENSRWLDALELGASDYCGAPFETIQVRWLVDAVMRASRAAA